MRILKQILNALNNYYWDMLFIWSIMFTFTAQEQLVSATYAIIATIALAVLEITKFTPTRNKNEQSN